MYPESSPLARPATHPRPERVGPASSWTRDRLEGFFVENLDLIDSVVHFVCRRRGVAAAEMEEFGSEVKVKLVDRDYEVLRRFEGRSSLRTYLTVVITRLYLDHRNSLWGKWRPSVEARRLGPVAVRLEALMGREGLTFAESSRRLLERDGAETSERELFEIVCRLPVRPRRVMVGDAALDTVAAADVADDGAMWRERRATALRIAMALRPAIARLPERDRLILRLRYIEGVSVAEIGRVLGVESKPLYRQADSVLAVLRTALEGAGIAGPDVEHVVHGRGGDISLALLAIMDAEVIETRTAGAPS